MRLLTKTNLSTLKSAIKLLNRLATVEINEERQKELAFTLAELETIVQNIEQAAQK